MSLYKVRNIFISIFVILWLAAFHYESTRHFYLESIFQKPLPKIKWLFPPAGWIMFYNVDDQFGYVEVYGIKNGNVQRLDAHDIIETRTIMFDNIQRNILSSVADENQAKPFCGYLRRKFPYFDEFMVVAVYYPGLIKERFEQYQQVKYRCVK